MDKLSSRSLAGRTCAARPRHGPPIWIKIVFLAIIALSFSRARLGWPSWQRSTSTAAPTDQSLENPSFDWDSISSHATLKYTPCYDKYQCAKLSLPMDYFNGTTDAYISLAVIRLPAAVSVTHPQYGGAVLLNPGGPGGSGIGFVQRAGKQIRETIDEPRGGKYFDLISFDPRAVGETTPSLHCVKSRQLDHSWQVRVMEEGVFEASDAALGRLWSMGVARGKSCALPAADGEQDIRKYATTASVARDMLELVERHGRWREQQALELLSSAEKSCHSKRLSIMPQVKPITDVPYQLRYKPGEERLQYWGFSYGTYLGNTFAAMFPERVHRIVVDGVVDAYNYKKTLWSDNLLDTEKGLDQFFYHCARVGYPTCALANETGDTTSEGVRQRVKNITDSLYHNPLPVVSKYNPEVVTYSDVKNLIAAGLYTPIGSFPYIANLLSGIERGDGAEFAELLHGYHDFQCPERSISGSSFIPLRNTTKGVSSTLGDGTMAIACTDGDDQSFLSKDGFIEYAKELADQSPSIGSMWSIIRMDCIHYSIRPHYRFEGPWVANTSHPLIMVGNTADPVTPVIHARNMAKGFGGAVALTQDSAGHCSSAAHSNCTVGYIGQYFQTGELPPPGTTCAADELPFGPGSSDEVVSVKASTARERTAIINEALQQYGGWL
ncbi:TAP-like protein [Teratosphaeria destructans]|uniref:TAP-like protein n=1 Tax=Teratosphaeria destructans TaxID=418781 RepID=A0A9W7SUU5_9PEZI|nr:TAP-like protein [Teratosphaeria destructans]